MIKQTGDNNVNYSPKIIEITLSGPCEIDIARVLYVSAAVLVFRNNLELDEVKINLEYIFPRKRTEK